MNKIATTKLEARITFIKAMYLERSVYFFIELDGRVYGVSTLTRFCLGVLKSAFMGTTWPCWLPELLSLRFSLLFTVCDNERFLVYSSER